MSIHEQDNKVIVVAAIWRNNRIIATLQHHVSPMDGENRHLASQKVTHRG